MAGLPAGGCVQGAGRRGGPPAQQQVGLAFERLAQFAQRACGARHVLQRTVGAQAQRSNPRPRPRAVRSPPASVPSPPCAAVRRAGARRPRATLPRLALHRRRCTPSCCAPCPSCCSACAACRPVSAATMRAAGPARAPAATASRSSACAASAVRASARSGCGPAISCRADAPALPGPGRSAPGPAPATGPAASAAALARSGSVAARARAARRRAAAGARRVDVELDIELAGEQTLHRQPRHQAARHQRRPPSAAAAPRCDPSRSRSSARSNSAVTGTATPPGPSGARPKAVTWPTRTPRNTTGAPTCRPNTELSKRIAPPRWRRTSACCRRWPASSSASPSRANRPTRQAIGLMPRRPGRERRAPRPARVRAGPAGRRWRSWCVPGGRGRGRGRPRRRRWRSRA